ncbi:MAG: CpsD/CapB family tyrosine-protein kinase [Limnochordaceae bacterium]|nr:CpsD/CapB family tyrosine-protein kinase [Limnochordaceae bacterium]
MKWPWRGRRAWEDGAGVPPLVVTSSAPSIAAEAFRNLRANLQYAALGGKLRTVVVTACGPDEGKTTIVANLGVAMAQAGARVLVVGADLRRPVLHRVFGRSHHVGLVSVLAGRLSLEEAVQRDLPGGVELLASGPIPPNPAELLASARLSELMEEMKARWDVVLFDSPPVVALSDGAILAARADGALLVVTMGQTPREMVAAARRQIEQVGGRILGVVVNKVRPQEAGQYYHYYYYYYADGTRRSRSSGRADRSGHGLSEPTRDETSPAATPVQGAPSRPGRSRP